MFCFMIQQFVMVFFFYDLILIYDDNVICIVDGRKVMGNNQYSLVFVDGFYIVLDDVFGFVVECVGCFVKDEDVGIGD